MRWSTSRQAALEGDELPGRRSPSPEQPGRVQALAATKVDVVPLQYRMTFGLKRGLLLGHLCSRTARTLAFQEGRSGVAVGV